jgi:hypothetical protein
MVRRKASVRESLTAIAKHIQLQVKFSFTAMLGIRNRIRIRRIRMILGLPDPDPPVRGTDPERSRIRSWIRNRSRIRIH